MTAFAQVPSLVSFSPLTTILSADVNANYAAIRNVLNGLISASNTIAVDTITENTAANGVTVNKKFTVSAGVATFASGIAITSGVVSGVATFSSGWAVSGGTINVSGVSVSGVATFTSGWAISGGVVSGAVTFSSGIAVTGNVAIGGGLYSFNGTAATLQNVAAVGGVLSGGTGLNLNVSQASTGSVVLNVGASGNSYLVVQQSTSSGTGIIFASSTVVLGLSTLSTAATVGFVYIPTAPATASSTPAAQGGVPVFFDTTNNRLNIYNGGWKQVLLA